MRGAGRALAAAVALASLAGPAGASVVGDALAAIESAGPVRALRMSSLAYPIVNALHILGIGVLVGAILVLDLRLLSPAAVGWRSAARYTVPVAAAGLALALASGALLFAVRATSYAANPAMLAKFGLILAGLANIAIAHRILRRADPFSARPPGGLRLTAALSAGLWIAALFAGRFVAFVE